MRAAAVAQLDEAEASAAGAGVDIRALRKGRGMTLAELAGHLGRSIGWLSQVERGQTEPAIADLRKLARLFNIPISFFFRNDAAPEHERGLIVRRRARGRLGSNEDGLTEELLSPDLGGDFEMIRTVIAPGAASDTLGPRPATDAGYLVSGRLSLWIGERGFELEPGDSFRFCDQTYRWANPGDEPAVVVWVVSPPIY